MSRRRTGADSLTRTDDLPLTRRLLYQLSYAGPKADYTCPPHALPRDAGDALRERRAGFAGAPPSGHHAAGLWT